MSEYELNLLRQRGIAARDSKASRGEYRFMLPPWFCWSEAGKIEIDPDEHVVDMVRLVFAKFRELGSRGRFFCGCDRPTSRCPSSDAISKSKS